MLYQNYTVKDLSNLPADYIMKEIEYVKRLIRRLKDKLYWRYDANPESRGELYLIYDDVLRGWAFLSDAREVLLKRGEYKVGVMEQRLMDKRAAFAGITAVEYEMLSPLGLESAVLDIEGRNVSVSSTIAKGEWDGEIRKDIAENFLKSLSELHVEEWKKEYRLLGEAYLTDVPSWRLVLTLADGSKVKYSGRGDYPFNYFKLKDAVHKLMDEVISQ